MWGGLSRVPEVREVSSVAPPQPKVLAGEILKIVRRTLPWGERFFGSAPKNRSAQKGLDHRVDHLRSIVEAGCNPGPDQADLSACNKGRGRLKVCRSWTLTRSCCGPRSLSLTPKAGITQEKPPARSKTPALCKN